MHLSAVSFIFIVILQLIYIMGLTKTDIYSDEQNKIASFAKVIGHPARVAILQHLLKMKTCICGELVEEIGLAQATISQHLREMKQIGLIQGNIDGTKVCYCINWKTYKEINQLFEKVLGQKILDEENCC